jgi:nucleoside-diphosphate-sugar epimerase
MAKYFITGAAGFVGRHLLQKISAKDNELFCLCRPSSRLPSNMGSVYRVEGDLLDIRSYKDALKGTDYLIHLAGLLRTRRKEEYRRVNVEGTAALLEACRETGTSLRRFVHMSSIAAVGPKPEASLLNESDPCFPQSEYGKSKYQAEKVVLSYAKHYPVVILRPTFIYGRGDLRGLQFLQSLRNPSSLAIASRIKTICLCHVSDVAQSCCLALKKNIQNGEIFIVSDPEVSTFETVWQTLIEIVGGILGPTPFRQIHRMSLFPALSFQLNPTLSETVPSQFWACDISKARTILGFSPKMPFPKGALDTMLWYINQGLLSQKEIEQLFYGNKWQ